MLRLEKKLATKGGNNGARERKNVGTTECGNDGKRERRKERTIGMMLPRPNSKTWLKIFFFLLIKRLEIQVIPK